MAKIKLGKWEVEEEELKREIAEATQRGKEAMKTEPRAKSAHFDPASKRLVIELVNGCVFICPTDLLPELRGARAAELADFELMPRGFDLHWKRLDAQFTVAGLLNDLCGAGAEPERHILLSATKREAHRENGKKSKQAGAKSAGTRRGRKAA